MCQFITIVLPVTIKVNEVATIFSKYNFNCRVFNNESVQHQLSKGGILISTAVNQCDCDSVVASATRTNEEEKQQKDIEKLKAKGWSESKISNWLESKSKSGSHVQAWAQERNNWIYFLNEMINDKKIAKVGMYMHWFTGTLEEEKIVFESKQRISLLEFQKETLDSLSYDTLYEFVS